MQEIKLKLDKEPNTFKKLLINVGVMKKEEYKKHRQEKYAQLFTYYDNIRSKFEELRHSPNLEDKAFLKEHLEFQSEKAKVKGSPEFLPSSREKLHPHKMETVSKPKPLPDVPKHKPPMH